MTGEICWFDMRIKTSSHFLRTLSTSPAEPCPLGPGRGSKCGPLECRVSSKGFSTKSLMPCLSASYISVFPRGPAIARVEGDAVGILRHLILSFMSVLLFLLPICWTVFCTLPSRYWAKKVPLLCVDGRAR